MGGRQAARVVLMTAALALTACGSPTGGAAPVPEATSTPAPTSAPSAPTTAADAGEGTVITVRDSEYGPMLFDEPGQAIYLFDKETTSTPACYGECAAAWPPVLTDGAPQPMGADAHLLGTTKREDGAMQVTYAGHPLYYYSNEDRGEVLCHDVDDFGGTWLVVTPAGTPAPA
jgi:predicted lipoprotein with Yx(FWY)xxD motif